jgi:hypothetical protein
MKSNQSMPFDGSSSAPTDASINSGGGSIMASIFARGVVVSRHTSQGSMQPFGQDTGTAADNTVLGESHDIISHLQSTSGTGQK